MLCAEARIASTKEGMEAKKRRQNNVWLKRKGWRKKLTGNVTIVEGGHVKKGCTDAAATIV